MPPFSEISFRDCTEGYLPNKDQIKRFSRDLTFKLNVETLNKISSCQVNTILEIRTNKDNEIVFIGKFIGGEMIYCYGDKPEWFNSYREIFGEYEFRDVPIFSSIS